MRVKLGASVHQLMHKKYSHIIVQQPRSLSIMENKVQTQFLYHVKKHSYADDCTAFMYLFSILSCHHLTQISFVLL